MPQDKPKSKPKMDDTTPRGLDLSGRHVAAIVIMAAMFTAALGARNVIRAHWWTWRLSICESDVQRAAYVGRLQSLGTTAVGPSMSLSTDPDPDVRLAGVRIWRTIPDERSVSAMALLVGDSDARVRRATILGLGDLGTPSAIELLKDVIGSDNERDAMIAAAALGRMRSQASAPVLARALQSSRHAGVKVQIIECIDQGRRIDLIGALIDILEDTAVFSGLTEGQIHAQRVFAAVRSDAAAQLGDDGSRTLEMETSHVVGRRAADTLRTLTGQSFGYDVGDAKARSAAILCWRDWLASSQLQAVFDPSVP